MSQSSKNEDHVGSVTLPGQIPRVRLGGPSLSRSGHDGSQLSWSLVASCYWLFSSEKGRGSGPGTRAPWYSGYNTASQ